MTISRTLILLAAALPALVQAADDVIVVTATRSERALQDVIVPVTVINREQIEQSGASDIADLLRFEAGLDIGRNGGPGQATSLFLRGTESNHVLVLMDGVRINPGTIGGAALQNIAPEIIERIEIVKGGRSSLYGTDAIGGVINIITRRVGNGYAEAGAGAGSFGTQSGYFSGGHSFAKGEIGATVNLQETDGYAIRRDSDIKRGYDNVSANLFGKREFGDTSLSLRHWMAEGRSEYLDFFLAPVSQDYRNQATSLEIAGTLGRQGHSRLILSYIVDEIEQVEASDYVQSDRLAADWQYSRDAGNHSFAGGLYFTSEDAEALSFGSGFAESTDTRAVFLQDAWSRDRHRSFVAVRYTDHETFGGELTWNVEYAFDVTERLSVNAGLGHAFRAPDATDRFGFGGNPLLEPEVSDEVQLGAQFDVSSRQSLRLELYRNDIDDLIDFNFTTFTLQNISSAEVRGAQLGWSFDGDIYDLRADIVTQSAENAVDGSKLLRRPEQSLTLSMQRAFGDHLLGLSAVASGEREDFAATLPGYVLMNFTGQFRLARNWHLNARVENILDTDYETASPYRMAERSAFLEIRYRWQ